MHGNKKMWNVILVVLLSLPLSISNVLAVEEPNGNYSSLVLSFRNSTLSSPVCVGGECHTELSGPAVVFSQQIVPNIALGLSGSYLQSGGSSSTLRLSGGSVFLELIAGIGSALDVGVVAAALQSSVQVCLRNPASCTSVDDTGRDVGVFGVVYLDESKSTSVTLSYDSISYRTSASQSIIGLSLVTVLAEHHRLALSADTTRDSGGKSVSEGYGFGYSYIF